MKASQQGEASSMSPCNADGQSRATEYIVLGTFGAFLTNNSWRETPYLTLEFLFNNP